MTSESLTELRARWDTPEGKALLEKLWSERIRLVKFEDGIAAVKKAFDVYDLRGIDFSGLSMMDQFLLFDFDISYSNFSRSSIYGSFQYSKMRHSKFDGARIVYGFFGSADMTGASFKEATIEGAEFSSSLCNSVSFENALLDDVRFCNVDLTTVNFDGVRLGEVYFGRAKLRRTPFLENLVNSSKNIRCRDIEWV